MEFINQGCSECLTPAKNIIHSDTFSANHLREREICKINSDGGFMVTGSSATFIPGNYCSDKDPVTGTTRSSVLYAEGGLAQSDCGGYHCQYLRNCLGMCHPRPTHGCYCQFQGKQVRKHLQLHRSTTCGSGLRENGQGGHGGSHVPSRFLVTAQARYTVVSQKSPAAGT